LDFRADCSLAVTRFLGTLEEGFGVGSGTS
jgi:hypothetical protein